MRSSIVSVIRLPAALVVAAALLFPVPARAQSATPLDRLRPGALIEVIYVGPRTVEDIVELATPMFDIYGVPDLSYSVRFYRIRYRSTDFDGTPVEIGANVFVPHVAGEGAFPLLVFGSGTTGVSDPCAPSLERPQVRRWGHYEANMLAYAGSGVITVFPDYLGFNDPQRPQRYFSKHAEAHVMLDAVRAARSFLDNRGAGVAATEHTFLGGYSQGGHAAFSAADLREEYAPDVSVTGLVSYGGTMNVETLMREAAYYSPYILYTYRQMHGPELVNTDELLLGRWSRTLEQDVLSMCVDQFQLYYPFEGAYLYSPGFHDSLTRGNLEVDYPELKRILDENIAGLTAHGIPSLVIQGGDDIIVTTKAQEDYVRRLCRLGNPVRYLLLEGVRHRFTRAAGFRATLAWMRQIIDAEIPPSTCGDL